MGSGRLALRVAAYAFGLAVTMDTAGARYRAVPGHVEKRVALVIGNSAYDHVSVANPANEASSEMIAARTRLPAQIIELKQRRPTAFEAARRRHPQ
jgi:hypothetical protein